MNEDPPLVISVGEKFGDCEFEDISDFEPVGEEDDDDDDENLEDECDEEIFDNDNTNAALIDLQVFIIGFQLCANETINYLINDEGLSPEDPMVVKLWEHLKLQEKMITAEYLKLINLIT